MLSKSDTDITQVIATLQSINLDACFIVPTKTGMSKSILDATNSVQAYFQKTKFHDYDNQKQGSHNKRLKQCFFINGKDLIKSKVSLYRPNTKSGDPRIWLYSLGKYAKPNNLLALTVIDLELYVINCSDEKLIDNLGVDLSYLNLRPAKDKVFQELLNKMKDIYDMGFVKSVGNGSKSVGETLEYHLGISPNSNKAPDFKGIELKSSQNRKIRSTLFSKTPNWKLSRLKNTKEILTERGVFSTKDNRIALYHSLKANIPNSYNMLLRVDLEQGLLRQNFLDERSEINDVNWVLNELKESLIAKHPRSFWVKAEKKIKSKNEYFNYVELIYTHSPNPNYFVALLESGLITVDYLMHMKGNGAARDHGYLFKILPENLDSLFPKPEFYNLANLG